jgi:hypothetical protein
MTTLPPSPSTVAANWEYLKTLISIFAGFITAFSAEPVKVYFTNRAKKSNLRRSLYGEILGVYNSFFTFLVFTEERGMNISLSKVVNTNFDCYKFAKADPALFYQLKEASLFNQIYGNIELLKQESDSGIDSEKSVSVAKLIVLQIEHLLVSKKLDKKIVFEYCADLTISSRVKKLFSGKLQAGELVSLSQKNKDFR